MAAPRQLAQMAFAAGIDQAQQAEVLDPSAGFPLLQNGRRRKLGAYEKRYGFAALGSTLFNDYVAGSEITAAHRIFADDKSLCLVDGSWLYAYSTGASRWRDLGRVSEATYRLEPIPSVSTAVSIEDVAYAGGFVVAAYAANTQYIYTSVTDAATGTLVLAPEVTHTGSAETLCSLAAYGNYVFLFIAESGSANIAAYLLDTSSPASMAWASLGNVATDKGGGGYASLRVSAESLTDRVAIAYVNNSGGASQLTVKTVNNAGVMQTQTINTSSVTPVSFAVAGTSTDTLWVAWNETTTVKVCGLSPSSLSTTLATTASILTLTNTPNSVYDTIAVAPSSTAGKGRVFAVDTTAVRTEHRDFTTTAGAAATDGSQYTIHNAFLASRPANIGGRYYALWVPETSANPQEVAMLCDCTEDVSHLRPVVNIEPGLAGVSASRRCHIVSAGSSRYYAILNVKRSGVAFGAALVRFDFADRNRWQAVRFGNSTYLSGGILQVFDGRRAGEAGFLVRPSKPTVSAGGTGINIASPGRKYVAIYERVDADGNWHVSGVSTPSDATGAQTNKTITVTTKTLTISAHLDGYTGTTSNDANGVRVVLYATDDTGQAPYYRHSTVINTTASQTVTFTDAKSESTLRTGAKLYTQPGINGAALDRDAPPGLGVLVEYNGMLVGWNGSDLWYSGQPVRGEGAWFSAFFQVPVDGDGDGTALAVLDGALYAFKRRDIYVLSGEPPADNGSSGGLGAPRRIASDVGCIDQRSVVVTSKGVFFQSERGIELLTRAQSVEYVGERVQDTLASYPVINAATYNPLDDCVYIECSASSSGGLASGNGRTIVYDCNSGVWESVDVRTASGGTAQAPAQHGCVAWDGSDYRYAWVDTGGTVHIEDDSTHLDPGSTWVTMQATTGWMKFAGIQGRHFVNRLQWLCRKATRADLSVELAYDYSETYKTAATWTANTLDTLSTALGRIQLEHPMHDEAEGVAVRVRLSDATPTGGTVGTGEGATWIALTYEGTPREGATDLPDESR